MGGQLRRDLVALAAGRSRKAIVAEFAAVWAVTATLWLAGSLFMLMEPLS